MAVLEKRGRFLVAEPLFGRGPRTAVERGDAGPGDLVLVGSGKRGARVVRVLGRPDRARDVVEGLMLDRGLHRNYGRRPRQRRWPPRRSPSRPTPGWTSPALPTFTIDPDDAKDFDDAISATRENGRVRLWVHIADVTAYLRPGGPLEREAIRRATSVYVPGAVEPMLPEVLSNRACSLRPGEEKLAVTVELEMEGADGSQGRVPPLAGAQRRPAHLRPGRRGVRRARARAASPGPRRWRWRARSPAPCTQRRDSLSIGAPEPVFEFDTEGHVVGVRHEEQTESHSLIEALMVLANEQVAGYLEDRKLPTLYRVHERPEPRSVEFLADQLASLDIPTPPLPKNLTPQQAADAAAEMSRIVAREAPDRRAIGVLVLRALKQAFYSPRNLGHAGLASARYTHFTSPIRRFPDVVAHRALLQGLGIDDAAFPAGARRARGAHLGPGARGDADRAQGRRRVPRLPARAPPGRGRPGGAADVRG